jgi:hypothetical protein
VRPNSDEILLNRYVDGELADDEKRALEDRLAADSRLRSQLAELVALGASIDLALAGVSPDEALAEVAPKPWYRRPALAAGLAVLVIGGAFVGVREWQRRLPQGAPVDDLAAVRPMLAEIVDPRTSHLRRLEIYDSWRALLTPAAFERLAWEFGPREQDLQARAALFMHLPQGGVSDVGELLRQLRANWSSRTLPALTPLMALASRQPTKEAEDLFADVLWNGPDLDPDWLANQVQWIQTAFPASDRVNAFIVRALEDPSERLQARAALARASVGAPEGVEHAFRLLASRSAEIRKLAIVTIARHGKPGDRARLTGTVGEETIRGAVQEAAGGASPAESRRG